jgi:hypothetical protein
MRWQQESIKISVVMYRKEYLLFIYFKLTDILYISYSQPISNKTEGVTQQLTCTWATASVVLETPERARERERARPRARAGGERYVIRNYSITVQKTLASFMSYDTHSNTATHKTHLSKNKEASFMSCRRRWKCCQKFSKVSALVYLLFKVTM